MPKRFLLWILKTALSLYGCFENSVLNMVKGSTVRGIGVAEKSVNRRWRKERPQAEQGWFWPPGENLISTSTFTTETLFYSSGFFILNCILEEQTSLMRVSKS